MNTRYTLFDKKPDKTAKKTPDQKMQEFIKKIEKDEIRLNVCNIPGKDGDVYEYRRPWKL